MKFVNLHLKTVQHQNYNMQKIKAFLKKSWNTHPILTSVVGILLSFLILSYLSICFLDIWTHHGSTTKVPDVIGMPLNEAIEKIEDADLHVIISDSVYTKDKAPGSVVDVIPSSNSIVKAGREVYITIVAFSPEPIIIDMLLIDSSAKQAEAYLKSKGLRVERRYVPAEYDDIVVAVKCNGHDISVGSKVTVDDLIILEVGHVERPVEEDYDPLDILIDASVDFNDGSTEGSFEEEEFNLPANSSNSGAANAISPAQQVSNSFGKK